MLIKLFLLVSFFLAFLSLECSPNQSSRSSSVLIPLMLDVVDLSPSLSLLKKNQKKQTVYFCAASKHYTFVKLKKDPCSYLRNLSICKRMPETNSDLNGIRTHDLRCR